MALQYYNFLQDLYKFWNTLGAACHAWAEVSSSRSSPGRDCEVTGGVMQLGAGHVFDRDVQVAFGHVFLFLPVAEAQQRININDYIGADSFWLERNTWV